MRLTGGLIRLLRVSKQLKQKEFSERLGISITQLSFIENGIKPITPDLEARIRKVYAVDDAVLTVLAMLDHFGKEGRKNDAKNAE
ncbi:MAG: helix-turn-helix transcriptional regulator [Firmicutes bacterium]|nr:helix-turn-helix transcriptional regulator [Bacillota bacterium]